jgi:fructokinase
MLTENHRVVCFGEVLWDILPSGSKAGGAPMNVAYHLKTLGENPILITRVGLDSYGKDLIDMMEKYGICTDFFQIDREQPTGRVFARFNDEQEMIYDIVFPSAWDFIKWEQNLSSFVQQAEYFIYGSLTCRSASSRDTLYRLLESANTKILDINLRPPHFSRSHIEYILKKADVLKMNIHELELVTGWFGKTVKLEDRVSLLRDRFDIKTIIVTKGAEGALISSQGKNYHHSGYSVSVADTVGSGDAFLAGFLFQWINGSEPQEALNFASALGALIATYRGACPNYDLSEILSLMKTQIKTEDHI